MASSKRDLIIKVLARAMGIGILRIDGERPVDIGLRLGQRDLALIPPPETGVGGMDKAQHGVERRRVRIERQRLLPAAARADLVLAGDRTATMGEALDPEVPGRHVRGGGVAEPRLLPLGEPHLHLGREPEGDLVLHRENVVDGAIEPLRPDMGAGRGVDELRVIRTRCPDLRTLPSST